MISELAEIEACGKKIHFRIHCPPTIINGLPLNVLVPFCYESVAEPGVFSICLDFKY